MPTWLVPVSRSLAQLGDPAFRGVLLRCLAWSLACFAALHAATIWIVHRLLAFHGWLAWTVDILGSIGASLLAFWLFIPLAAAIGTLYSDRIAEAVERRFYPWLPPAQNAPLVEQIWDGVTVAAKVLALSIAALALALLIPGIGLLLGWLIASYAIGRGLFVAIAMRRLPRPVAETLYLQHREVILVSGGLLALAAYIPLLNLLVPIIGTAAMVHIFDMAIAQNPGYRPSEL
jgi:CysZ protein